MDTNADAFLTWLHACQVLVVEDSELQRMSAVSTLRRIGFDNIREAANGIMALDIIQRASRPPEIILLDLEMPDMDGIELLQHIAQEGIKPNILLMSSADPTILSSIGEMVEALALPLMGMVTKPISEITLASIFSQFRGRPSPTPDKSASRATSSINATLISRALDEHRIRPHYQPVVDLAQGKVTSFEALARWEQADGSIVLPGAFIAEAERGGLISRLTLAMLDHILEDIIVWRSEGLNPVVSLNVSAHSLSGNDIGAEIVRRTMAAGVSPRQIIIEVTESALVSDWAAALAMLGRLRLKGFGLSIDDYGTGFSSMHQLSKLPFTTLKIDRSFVHDAQSKWNLQTILQSAIEMGHRLKLVTVAEGVETVADLRLLQAFGCRCIQGFLISPAMRHAEVNPWLTRESDRIRKLCASTRDAHVAEARE